MFVLQEDHSARAIVFGLTVFVYILFLIMICKTASLQVSIAPNKPMVVIYEQTYIDTDNRANSHLEQKTKYFGANDQTAAQELPPTKLDDDPTIRGKEASQKLIPDEPIKIPSPGISTSVDESSSGRTLKDFLNKENLDDIGETIRQSNATNIDDQHIALNHRKHRKALEKSIKQRIDEHKNEHVDIQNLRSVLAPIRRSDSSVTKIGKISMNVNGSEFGEYEQRLLEAISYRWEALSERSGNILMAGRIVIKYTLNKDGTITDLDITKYTTSREAALICLDAVASQSPQPAWSDDMVEKFGDKKQMAVQFIYY